MSQDQQNQPQPEQDRTQAGRGIYFLPQIFTTAGLFSGFYAIVAGMKHQYAAAAIAIFVSMLMDTLDGRVARMTNTQSAFGAEYDSLSDMVAFGVAPALVIYAWALQYLGKPGWLVAFFYAATTALRLARFNSRIAQDSKAFFLGLPCPAAAGVIAGLVAVGQQYHWQSGALQILSVPLIIGLGLLMVSNVSYYSFKELDVQKKVPYFWGLISISLLILIAINPPIVLFAGFSIYALSGLLYSLRKRLQRAKH